LQDLNQDYQNKNKEHIKQYKKEYEEKNKEQIKQYKKEYREKNQERIKTDTLQKICCECGIEVCKKNMSRHIITKKHFNYRSQRP
jgi:hypothetical protein